MSNTPSSPVILRIPQPALVFIILVLTLGALVLLSQNIDPKASVRAEFTATPSPTFTPSVTPTPIKPFADLQYVAWASPEGYFELEHPKVWQAQKTAQAGPVAYVIQVPGQNVFIRLQALPTRMAIDGAAEDSTPRDLLKLAFPDQPEENFRDVQIGELKGTALKRTVSQQDPATGQTTSIDADVWLVNLDPKTLLILQAVSPAEDWPNMQKVLDHMVSTLKIKTDAVVAALDEFFEPTAVPGPTGTPTAEATAGPAETPTVESSPGPTATATPELAATPTAEPTRTATPAP